jgi:hypothetical protein
MFEVISCDKSTCDKWVSTKHYSRRPSIFWNGFCLVIDGKIEGVIVYGQPSAPIQKHAFADRDFRLYELTRLVVQTKEKNAASYLISHSLKMLERPCAVVSYADTAHGHCGIVYQATNWIYTGATISHDKLYMVDGKLLHPMTLRDRGITSPMKWAKENNIEVVKPKEKHRYFYLCGSKVQCKSMTRKLKYGVVEKYPKLEKTLYDDGENICDYV